MVIDKERRDPDRMDKRYQVFCKTRDRSSIGESYNISEKGMGLLTNLDMQLGDSIEVRIVPKDEIFSFTCEGTVHHVEQVSNGGEYTYKVGIEFLEGLKDFAAEQLVGGHEHIDARKSIVISANQQDCYDAICNFESYPSWQKTVHSVNVLKRGSDKRPLVVEFFFDLILKRVRVVNQYEYFDKDFILSWKAIEGDVKVNKGNYVFQKLRDDRTNAIFSVFIEMGFYAPKRIVDYMNNITMRNSIRSLKQVVESGKVKK